MTPSSGVVDISAEQARYGRGGQEFDFFATVISACEARLAFVADDVGFNCDSVADFERFD